MKYCIHCGVRLNEKDRFCESCGGLQADAPARREPRSTQETSAPVVPPVQPFKPMGGSAVRTNHSKSVSNVLVIVICAIVVGVAALYFWPQISQYFAPSNNEAATHGQMTTDEELEAGISVGEEAPIESDFEGINSGEGIENLAMRARASASSSLGYEPDSGWTYNPENVLDGYLDTCWAEGVKGYGQGEWIELRFDSPVVLTEIRLAPGYFKNPGDWDRWRTNGKLKQVEVVWDEDSMFVDIEKVRRWHIIEFDEPVETAAVTIRITGAYRADAKGKAAAYNSADTCISEIEPWGYVR